MLRSPLLPSVLSLRTAPDRLVDQVFGGTPFQTVWSRSGSRDTLTRAMPIDVYATDDHAVVMAAVPGMNPDDLEVTVYQNTVTLRGSVSGLAEADEIKDATWYVHEFGSGTFQRSVTLPFGIDADAVDASFEHGIVKVTLPKAERARPRRIAVGTRASTPIATAQPEAISGGASDETPAE